MSLPKMGVAILPRKCHFCTFFEAEAPHNGTLAEMRTFCTVDPKERREMPLLSPLNDIDWDCPLAMEMGIDLE